MGTHQRYLFLGDTEKNWMENASGSGRKPLEALEPFKARQVRYLAATLRMNS